MKKKFLSLMMAAAVVATTSVSAFAAETISTTPTDATGKKPMTISEGEGQTTDIGITGNIADRENKVVPSTINVTVPTAAKFTVTNGRELVGSNITIKNEGTGTVSVIAEKFIDTTDANRINVVSESDVLTPGVTERNKVSLKLTGGLAAVDLKTKTSNGLGIVKSNGDELEASESLVLDEVEGGSSKTLRLTGKAVKGGTDLEQAIDDAFTLILRIKKKA